MNTRSSKTTNPVTPIALFVTTWAVTKLAESLYEKLTGSAAPTSARAQSDNETPPKVDPMHEVLWSVGITAALALAEFVVVKLLEDDVRS
ncbi:MAG: hypothetical protein WCO64_06385 [Actinomycetes bacterium]